jgi:hypothetical protein
MRNALPALALLLAACGATDATPPNPLLELGDPAGDAVFHPQAPVSPDLRSAFLELTETRLLFEIGLAPGTDMENVTVGINFDADANPNTGDPFAGQGTEALAEVGAGNPPNGILVFRWQGGGYQLLVNPTALVREGLVLRGEIPRGLLTGVDRNSTVRLYATHYLGDDSWTGFLDYMPDRDLAPARISPQP